MTAMHQALSRALGIALIAAACVVLPAAASAQTGLQSLGKNNKGPINIQSDSLELRGMEAGRIREVAVDPSVDRETLAARLAIEAPLAIGDGLRAREAVLAEEEQ